MPEPRAWDRLIQSVRERPAAWALGGGVVLAGIVAGTLASILILGDPHQAVGQATESHPEPSLSPSASASAGASAAASAEPTRTPHASSSPSVSPTATATPAEASGPASTQAPQTGGDGGVGGPSIPAWDVTGTWTKLSPLPGGDEFMPSDAVRLADGRMVVFRWDYGYESEPQPEVVVYDPTTNEWSTAEFDGDRPRIGTDEPFALARDGRIYSLVDVIDPSTKTWHAEPFRMLPETEVFAGMRFEAGSDGRLYYSAADAGSGRTELVVFDPESGYGRTSSVDGKYSVAAADTDGNLLLFGSESDQSGLIRYDIDLDTWSDPVPAPPRYDTLDYAHVAVGPDGLAYVPGFDRSYGALWAIDPDDGALLAVEPPPDVEPIWKVDLVWSPDGRLYVFGMGEAWTFTPDD